MSAPTSNRLPANVWVLAATQAFGMSTTSMMALVSGLLAARIAPSPKLATLPNAMIVIGTALSMFWAPRLLQLWGRKRGSLVGFAASFLAAALGVFAATRGSFGLLLLCGFLFGVGAAFWQQMRFAALESVADPQLYPAALSALMMGGLASAFLGPEIGALGQGMLAQPFAGSFVLTAAVLACGLIAFLFFKEPPPVVRADVHLARPMREIVRRPAFIIAASAAAIGFGVMNFVMTATPINMKELCGFDIGDTKRVIQGHIVAMFAPSLVSGWLIARFGISRMMGVGAAMYCVVVVIGLAGQHLVHFWGSLLLLGVGWNLLFVGGTALLPFSYAPAEKFKAQAANDVIVFGSQAVAGLSAGWVLFTFGWSAMMFACVPFVLAAFALVAWKGRLGRVARAVQV